MLGGVLATLKLSTLSGSFTVTGATFQKLFLVPNYITPYELKSWFADHFMTLWLFNAGLAYPRAVSADRKSGLGEMDYLLCQIFCHTAVVSCPDTEGVLAEGSIREKEQEGVATWAYTVYLF